jgi:hypothetical protein
MPKNSYSRIAKEESDSISSFPSFKQYYSDNDNDMFKSSSYFKDEMMFEEDEDNIFPKNVQYMEDLKSISNNQKNKDKIENKLRNENLSNKLTQEKTTSQLIFNINKQKKVRSCEMRTQYIKSFFGKLQKFIRFLMKDFNDKKDDIKDKILPLYQPQNCKIFTRIMAENAYRDFCQEKKAYEILQINEKERKNTDDNIKVIDKIRSAVGEKRNEDLIEVLEKPIKELMDIYRGIVNPEKDFYKHFESFQDYLNELEEKEDVEPKKISKLKYQGMNYEAILNEIIDNGSKPGPRKKKK